MRLLPKFLLYFISAALLSAGVVVYYSNILTARILLNATEARVSAAATETGKAIAGSAEVRSESMMLTKLRAANDSVGGLYAMVIDTAGVVLAHTNIMEKGKNYTNQVPAALLQTAGPQSRKYDISGAQELMIAAPIWESVSVKEDFIFSGDSGSSMERMGTVFIAVPLKDIRFLQNRLLRSQALLALLMGALMAVVIGVFFFRDILRPIRHLAAGTRSVAGGLRTVAIPVLSDDELGSLTFLFNSMSKTLDETTVSMDRLLEEIGVRKGVEKELVLFKELIDRSSDAVFVVDTASEKIIDVNLNAAAILGYTKEEILQLSVEKLNNDPPEESSRRRHREEMREAASKIYEDFYRKKDGTCLNVEVSESLVQLSDRAYTLLIVRNIADRKAMQMRLAQSEKLSAVGQLAAGIAHEINNPLGVILGFAEGMRRRLNPESDPLCLPVKSIEREALRCKNLVRSLLTFSRRDSNVTEVFELDPVIRDALPLVQAQAKTTSVEMVSDLAANRSVTGQKEKLQQVVINLCSNAIDAMSASGGELTIRTFVRGAGPQERIMLEIEDTGEGISEKDMAKIFEPFFTTKDPGRGTGLGLSLVFEIVQLHGGTVDVKSVVGKGSVFTVSLPAAPVSHAPGAGVQA